MARLDRTLERFIREAEGGGAFDPYTLAKALDDAVAAPPEAAGEAVAPLVRFVDWAVRSGHNEGIDPASRASAARLAEFDQAGANPRNLPAFLAGVLAAAALFQLAPRDESQEPPASRRRDAARALLAAAEAWSDEATLIFARMLWDLHRPGGEFFGGGKVRAGEEDTRRQVLASLHSRWPAGAVREILGRVLARALGVRVREDASASPRELPRGVAEAIGLWARLGGDRERLGLRRPATPRALAEVEAKLGPRVPDALVSFYAQSDGLGGREIAAARALVGLQRELAATLGQHAAEAEAEGALALARGEIDVRTMGPPSTLLAIGTDGAGDYFLMRVGDPRVYRFVHDELCSVRPVATTLGAFVAGQMMLAHDRWRSDDAGERLVAREAKAAEAAVAEARRAARRQVARRAEGEASEAKPRAGASATRAGATRAGVKKAGVKKASAKEGPAKKGSATKASVKEESATKTGVKKASAKEGPAKKAGAKKAGVKEASATKAGVKKASAKEGPAKKAGAKKAGVKEASATKAGVKKASAKEGPAKKGSAKKGSAKKGSAKKGSAKKGSAKKGSAKKASAKKGSAKKGSAKKARTGSART